MAKRKTTAIDIVRHQANYKLGRAGTEMSFAYAFEKNVIALCDYAESLEEKLKDLADIVCVSCNPPESCNEPDVLKEYMRACFDNAIGVYSGKA